MIDCISSAFVASMFICFAITLPEISCYNFENRLPLFKFGEVNSSFGFSVTQHRLTKSETTGVADTLLVVGAPTAAVLPSLKGSVRYKTPGGVYYCPVSTNPDDCRRVQLDAIDEPPVSEREEIIKSEQWLGVSLRSQGSGDFLVTCAHRFRWHITNILKPDYEDEFVCGKCFLMKGTSTGDIIEISRQDASLNKDFISSPCEFLRSKGNVISSKKRFGYTQAGSSLFLTDSEYLLGGPGAWRWSGALFAIEMPEMKQNGEEPVPSFFESDVTPNFYQSMTCPTNEWKERPDKPKCNEFPLNRDSYMGFSVAMSDSILPNSKEMFYIAGAPRGNNTGAVVFFRKRSGYADDAELRPDEKNIVVGEAISSSFGYSIATTDINGDGLDDLIVGAPQYYEQSSIRKAGGAAYVYMNVGEEGFRNVKPQIFYGPKGSHFGHAVAAIGDIDQDGYGDFAIGAPYQEENGVVHIYRGSADGIVRKSQTISGGEYAYISQSSNRRLSGFGASMSGLVDADSNKYPDLLIGSLSDHVALIRTRPIIGVHMTFEIDRNEIDLNVKECNSSKDSWSCFSVTYCFEYQARHAEYRGGVELSYTLTMDSDMQESGRTARVVTDDSNRSSVVKASVVIPSAGTRICPAKKSRVIFLNQVKDRLSEIRVKIEYDLIIREVKREQPGEPVYDLIKDPILDADFNKTRSEIVKIKNSCGPDGCQSNLKINATMPNEIVLGQTNNLPVNIIVSNNKEEAHQARFTVTIPTNVTYSSVHVHTPKNITCGQITSDLLECEIGNPLRSDETAEMVVNFDVTGLDWKWEQVQIVLQGYTTSENPKIAPIILNAEIILELDIIVSGFGFPQQVRYKQKNILGESIMNNTDDIGSLITYSFEVTNRDTRRSPVVSLTVELPYEIYNGKWLLYLVATEVTSADGNPAGSCVDSDGNVNVLGLEPSFAGKSRLKRAAGIQANIAAGSRNAVQTVLSCGQGAECTGISCLLDELQPNEPISVKLYVRLWDATFLEEKILRTLDLVHIDTMSHVSTRFKNVRLNSNATKIRTTVDHPFFQDDILSAFPWWYILIAIVFLLLIYILIILILVRCGFFKRKRYSRNRNNESDAQEQTVP